MDPSFNPPWSPPRPRPRAGLGWTDLNSDAREDSSLTKVGDENINNNTNEDRIEMGMELKIEIKIEKK